MTTLTPQARLEACARRLIEDSNRTLRLAQAERPAATHQNESPADRWLGEATKLGVDIAGFSSRTEAPDLALADAQRSESSADRWLARTEALGVDVGALKLTSKEA